MASTYVNDLRLNEMATGDGSGTWGTTTNTNLELIAEAFSYGTEAITTNADTHTTTIADGSTDPGRSLYLKYTGTLDSACTITIGPDTVSKVWIIENGTSGSQDIILSQGSGANITIPAGDTKVVYSDGAGAGAAFFDAFASLSVVDLTATGIVTAAGTSVFTNLDISGDIDVDGTTNLDVVDIDGAVDMATTLAVAGNVDFNGDLDVDGTTNLDVVDIDGAVNMATTALVTGVLTTTAATVFNGGFASNAASTISTADNSAQITLISTDADASVGPLLDLYRNSASPADNDIVGQIRMQGKNSAGETIDYVTLFSQIQDVTDGTEDGRFFISAMTGGTDYSRMDLLSNESVFNQDGQDLDFRVESDTVDHALFVQGSDGNVGIGTSSPSQPLHVKSTGSLPAIFEGASHSYTQWVNSTGIAGYIGSSGGLGSGSATDLGVRSENNLIFLTNAGTERMRITTAGDVLVGATSTVSDSTIYLAFTGRGMGIEDPNAGDGSQAIWFRSGTTQVGSIALTPSATSYNTSSDYRLKENVVTDWDATTRLKQLKPSRFNFIVDADTTVDGFLAHEVQEIVPEAISGTKDAMRDEEYEVTPAVLDDDGNVVTEAVMGTRSVPDYQGIDQSKLVPLLVKTIQELEARITTLENA
jgi:hypothetical protein